MPASESQQIRFGEFVLDLDRGALQHAGEDVGLRPQAFKVLSYLAIHSGKLISRDELLDAVWGNATVTDDSLTQCIVEIRKAINDEAHSIVRTVPRRGFIFDPPETFSTITGDDSTERHSRGRRRIVALAAAGVVIVAMTTLLLIRPGADENPEIVVDDNRAGISPYSIAVLPFADMSATGDQQYFGDGIAEEILAKLTEYPELVVIARTSSFRFRDRQDDVIEIGRSLNAAYVLEGSIRKAGNRLRITAQLIETQGGTHEWSESFDKELTVENLLDIQSEVAASVADTIGTDAMRTAQRATRRETTNAEAYDLYLEGMYYLQQIRNSEREVDDPDIFAVAIDRFEASIHADPDWATPYAALGRTLHFRASPFQGLQDDEAFKWLERSKARLLQAIRIDPDYAPAYSSLGHVLHNLELDFTGAEAAYAKARKLGHYYPWGYAVFLAGAGRFDEAIEELKLAIELDPMSFGPRHFMATMYRCAGRYQESIAGLEMSLRLAPSRDDLYIPLAYLYGKTGDIQKGRALIEQHKNPGIAPLRYAPAFAMLGMADKAREAMEQTDQGVRWWLEDTISTLLTLGETERALDQIEAAAQEDPRKLRLLSCLYSIEKLDGNPRYEQLVKDAGFPATVYEARSAR